MTPVTFAPQSRASRDGVRPGNAGSRDGWTFRMRSRKARTTLGAEDPHVTRPAGRTRCLLLQEARRARVVDGPRGSRSGRAPGRHGLHVADAGPLEGAGVRIVGHDEGDRRAPPRGSSRSACRFVPDPEASTAIRASTAGTLRGPGVECQTSARRPRSEVAGTIAGSAEGGPAPATPRVRSTGARADRAAEGPAGAVREPPGGRRGRSVLRLRAAAVPVVRDRLPGPGASGPNVWPPCWTTPHDSRRRLPPGTCGVTCSRSSASAWSWC